ncbi:MAG: type II toxin-antitoxin system death-on-curing family toxin [Halobacteriota archaeon]
MNYKYLTKENIIRLHKKIIETTGGEKGLLNEGILSFVLDLIRTEKLYSEKIGDLFTRAGILLRGIISGHPFVDGNKRAGFEATDIFLRMNGYEGM